MIHRAIILALTGAAGVLGGCAYSVHQNAIASFSAPDVGQAESVSVEVKDRVVLFSTSDFSWINAGARQLAQKCKNGRVTGVSTRLVTDLGFFHWINRAVLEGSCTGDKPAP